MESAGSEHLDAPVAAPNGATADERPSAPKDAKDVDWVIQRIQDSFDSRAR